MKINDDLTKKIAQIVSQMMTSPEKGEGECRSKGEADFVNMHVDNIEVVDNRDENLGKTEEPKEEKQPKAAKVKTVKESSCEEEDMEEAKMSDDEIEEALSKTAPASEWIKDFVHSDNPMFKGKSKDERIKMALGAYYAKKNESVKLNEEAPVKYDIWVKQLADVVARSSNTKDLAMSFEAWANSLYKTPLWKSIHSQNPILSEIIDSLAEALDVYIGMPNEERESENETIEEQSIPPRKFRDMSDKDLAAQASSKEPGQSFARSQAKRVLDMRAKTSKTVNKGSDDGVEKAIHDRRREKGHGLGFNEAAEDPQTSTIAKEWMAATDKKAIIKKYSLAPAMSALRPGEIKLGIRNELNGKKSFPALDDNGELIIVSGTSSAPKIRYVKKEESTVAGDIAQKDMPLFKKQKNEGVITASNPEDFAKQFDKQNETSFSWWGDKEDWKKLMVAQKRNYKISVVFSNKEKQNLEGQGFKLVASGSGGPGNEEYILAHPISKYDELL